MDKIPDFGCDLFISYSHLDNQPLTKRKEQEGWISQFHHSLKVRLEELLGRETEIWRDEELRGIDDFEQETISKIKKGKVLMTILSPRYLNSDWCKKELNEFCKAAQKSGGICLGNKSRIFKIIKTPIKPDKQPPELKKMLGYKFYYADSIGRFRELRPEKYYPSCRKYWSKLEDVVYDLYQLVEDVEQYVETGTVRKASPEKTVYLAQTSSDIFDQRNNIKRDLKHRGFDILPDQKLPIYKKDGNLREVIHKNLNCCKLSIHIIGNDYGPIPEGEDSSIIDIQYELAKKLSEKDKLLPLLWMPSKLKPKEYRLKQFIDSVQNENKSEFIKTNLEEFKTYLVDKLKELRVTNEKEIKTDGSKYIYLLYSDEDKEDVLSLQDYLYDEEFEVKPPLFDGSSEEKNVVHTENHSLCNTKIIYFNHANECWLRTKLNEFPKIPNYQQDRSLIYICGEEDNFKNRFRTNDAMVIKHFTSFSSEIINPFLKKLRDSKEDV